MQRLHAKGLGTKKKQAEPIMTDEEAILWASGKMGCHDAQTLLNTIHFYNCKVLDSGAMTSTTDFSASSLKRRLMRMGGST